MQTALIAYFATLVAFLILEGGWLAVMGPKLYKPEIGALLAEKPKLPPAVLFYLLYVAGMVWLVVLPGVSGGWTHGLVNGAVLGLVAYGTYDLTCASTMKIWSSKVTIADMAWGAFASALASSAGIVATARFGG